MAKVGKHVSMATLTWRNEMYVTAADSYALTTATKKKKCDLFVPCGMEWRVDQHDTISTKELLSVHFNENRLQSSLTGDCFLGDTKVASA